MSSNAIACLLNPLGHGARRTGSGPPSLQERDARATGDATPISRTTSSRTSATPSAPPRATSKNTGARRAGSRRAAPDGAVEGPRGATAGKSPRRVRSGETAIPRLPARRASASRPRECGRESCKMMTVAQARLARRPSPPDCRGGVTRASAAPSCGILKNWCSTGSSGCLAPRTPARACPTSSTFKITARRARSPRRRRSTRSASGRRTGRAASCASWPGR